MTDEERLLQRCRMDPRWAMEQIVKLTAERDKLQHDLDAAVGYKLAVAQETRGDHGYEEG